MGNLLNDLRFTFRAMKKNPGFVAVAVFSLAIGIGVNTGINLDALLDSVNVARELAGQELAGHVLKARTVFEVSNFPEPLKIH